MTNGFSSDLLYKLVSRFLSSKVHSAQTVLTAPKKVIYLKIPYVGEAELALLRRNITSLFRKYYPYINLRLIPFNNYSIKSIFKYKDPIPLLLRSGVVYKYSCPRCLRGTYVGSTIRRLRDRICEHMGISHRTFCRLSGPNHSPILAHVKGCQVSIDCKDFSILSQTNPNDLRILESLFIKSLQPTINRDETSVHLRIA